MASSFGASAGWQEDPVDRNATLAAWAIKVRLRCSASGAAALTREGSLDTLKKLKAADLLDVDVSAVVSAVEGKEETSDGEAYKTGCADIRVLKWLVDEVEPKIALDATVFAAATDTEIVSVKGDVLSFLIGRACPMGTPDEQAVASSSVALRCKVAEMRALREAGCAWDEKTIGSILGAKSDWQGIFELIDKKKRPRITEDEALAKLSYALDAGCPHGSAERQAELVSCAVELDSVKVLSTLHAAGFV